MKHIDLDAVDPTLAFAGPFHDIRNVISTLQMDIDTLSDKSQSQLHKRLIRMERCINRCMDICNAALHQRDEHDEPVGLLSVAQEAASDLNALRPRNIIQVSSDSEYISVFAQKTHIYRVIFNLADNARKAVLPMESGMVQLHIGVDADTRQPYIDIRDNGPGMPDHVSRPRHTSPTAIDDSAPRHGVGLQNVRHLVEAMDVEMTIHPVAPHGTHIRLTFPETLEL